jgi:hypothetical protein
MNDDNGYFWMQSLIVAGACARLETEGIERITKVTTSPTRAFECVRFQIRGQWRRDGAPGSGVRRDLG